VPPSTRPDVAHAGIALSCTLVLALGLQLALRLPWAWPYLLVCWLAGANLTAFGYYGYDKNQARANGRRVPELVLHGVAVAGGTLGAYAGMQYFRHKTIKGPFQIFFWTVAILQAVLLAVAIWRLAGG